MCYIYVCNEVYEITFIGDDDDANVGITKFRTTELDLWDTILANEESTEVGKGNEVVLRYKQVTVELLLASQWPLMIAFVIAVVLGMHADYCNSAVEDAQLTYLGYVNYLFNEHYGKEDT